MTFLIGFLKGLLFIVCNMGTAFLLVYTVKFVLFHRRPLHFFGKEMPITQGFLVRKRNWLISKLYDLLQGYLRQAADENFPGGYLKDWEKKIFDAIMEKLNFVDDFKLLPRSWKEKIQASIANAVLQLVKQFLRKFVPFLIEKYHVRTYIELIDQKLDIDVIISYFNRYVYKPVLLIALGISFLIGFGNMILFWILD